MVTVMQVVLVNVMTVMGCVVVFGMLYLLTWLADHNPDPLDRQCG